jgi:hypothetical protein
LATHRTVRLIFATSHTNMKAFARLFFLIGIVLGVYLWLSPDTLKFVSIPADSSMITPSAPAAPAAEKAAPVASPAPSFVSLRKYET